MPIPVQSINVSELDFANIKKNLIDYFKTSDTPFKDWDYAGSNLNVLIDVLAHNTHYNAMLAHLAINETFIDSAQLRQNVVSSAKLIGYTPRSAVAATAKVDVEVQLLNPTSEKYTIPRGSAFSGNVLSNETGKNYDFTNLSDIVCIKQPQTNSYIARDVVLHQGYIETVSMQINNLRDRNEYVIDNTNIDTKTLSVSVYPEGMTELMEVYSEFDNVNGINEESRIYFLHENYNGNYVISFGNNVFGKRPDNLNILELSYVVSNGASGNKINLFTYSDFLDTSRVSLFQVTTTQVSYRGANREDISSIKYNAPLQYISQDRAVTADDYRTLIYAHYSNAKSISVWGGEDNDPPQYGKVFICIKKNSDEDDDYLSLQEKTDLLTYLKSKKVLSIMPEIVDPEHIDIVLDVLFKYNPNLTNLATTQVEKLVNDQIALFNEQNLQMFDGVFRHSLLSRIVDTSSPAILNSLIRVYLSKTFVLDPDNPKEIYLKYGARLQPDDGKVVISSTGFILNGVLHYFGDTENISDSNLRDVNLFYYDVTNGEKIIVDNNVGTINLNEGTVRLLPIIVDNTRQTISLDLIPTSNDIVARRNQLIRIDTNRINVFGEIDSISVAGSDRSIDYKTFSRDR
jgi:hypothetical protein